MFSLCVCTTSPHRVCIPRPWRSDGARALQPYARGSLAGHYIVPALSRILDPTSAAVLGVSLLFQPRQGPVGCHTAPFQHSLHLAADALLVRACLYLPLSLLVIPPLSSRPRPSEILAYLDLVIRVVHIAEISPLGSLSGCWPCPSTDR